jgi:hypothetical protein
VALGASMAHPEAVTMSSTMVAGNTSSFIVPPSFGGRLDFD